MKEVGITGCVVTGTSEADWPEVARLADKFPDFIRPAFGLHPWKINSRSSGWLATLKSYLIRFPHAMLGECGLDRWMKSPNLADQHQVFRDQMNLALSLNRSGHHPLSKSLGSTDVRTQGFPTPPPLSPPLVWRVTRNRERSRSDGRLLFVFGILSSNQKS